MSATATDGAREAYLDIVWRQFQKNRSAYWALWMLAPLFLLAIFAPLIASNQPFVFFENGSVLFPWFRALFNPEESADYVYNMALLVFPFWLVAAVLVNRRLKHQGRPGRQRLLVVAAAFLGMVLVAALLFLIPGIRPNNQFKARNFVLDQYKSQGANYGVYPPISFGPREIDLDARFEGPGFRKPESQAKDVNDTRRHWLGTDNNGRDVLVRMLYGTRISMSVGFVAVSIYVVIGVVVGAIAGYFGGVVDLIISRVIEVVLLFPAFFLILTLVAMIGNSIFMIMVVIGLTRWPTVARLIRGEVLKQRTIDYTVAARSLGASHTRIIFRHILPNAISPALVSAPFGVASAIVVEAGLSVLGFGVEPPTPTWGVLLRLGNSNYAHWWLIVIPSLAIFFTVTVFNLVGSGLRDAMDPRLRV